MAVIQKRKNIEFAKVLAAQAEERTNRKISMLEKKKAIELELEKEDLTNEAINARNKVAIAEIELRYEEEACNESISGYQIKNEYASSNMSNIRNTNLQHNNIIDDSVNLDPIIHLRRSPHYRSSIKEFSIGGKTENIRKPDILNPSHNDVTFNIQNRETKSANQQSQVTTREQVDTFIDELIEGQETCLDYEHSSINLQLALKQEYESRHLPPIELRHFNGNSSVWPEFIENFRNRVHFKVTFDDNMRMDRLMSVLEGDAKRSVESIGSNGLFYAIALKTLKRDFGNPIFVSHLKLKSVLDLPQITSSDRTAIRRYHQQLKVTITWLQSMGYETPIKSSENLTKAVTRLPNYVRQEFFKNTGNVQFDGIDLLYFERWLEQKLRRYFNPIANIIADVEVHSKNNERPHGQRRRNIAPSYINTIVHDDSKVENIKQVNNLEDSKSKPIQRKCWLCSGSHRLMECDQFTKKSITDRKKVVEEEKLCWNCLSKGHVVKDCKSTYTCKIEGCNKKHHTMLHHSTKPIVNVNSYKSTKDFNKTYLQVLPVIVSNGESFIETNALLDTGSDSTLIRQDIADILNLPGMKHSLELSNVMSISKKINSKLVSFNLSSSSHPNHVNVSNAWVVQDLQLPTSQITSKEMKQKWPHLHDIEFPPPNNNDVTILIGADMPHLLLHLDYKVGKQNDPVAIKTKLGWVLMGGKSITNKSLTNYINSDLELLSQNVEQFWAIESYGTTKNDVSLLPKNEQRAIHILESTTVKKMNRYEVGLLWKSDEPKLPNNRALAVSRLKSLESKFSKQPQLAEKYKTTINDYISKGHATKLTQAESSVVTSITNYIPHHGVTNPNKPGKVRVVFDAAAKYGNTSLNDNLLQGPDLLNNLVGLLFRFREGKYAIMADIEQMFHQIEVKKSDRDALRFVWRNHVTQKIEDYVMNVHLFGKVDSPCCANWALKKSASDQRGNYDDKVIGAVEKDFYMDDFLSSQPTKSEAAELAIQMIKLLSTGSFRLTKWISNDRDVIKSLPSSEVSTKIVSLDLKDLPIERALGVLWDTENDVLFIKAVLKDLPPTKRGVLSFVSSIFDPIGIVAPAVLEPKLIIQELWRRKIDWDTDLPNDLLTRWCKWKSNFKHITNIQIPRWYGFHYHESTNTDLHVFADSSKLAYGAVAYFRAEVNGQICCNFITGKSRLAPMKENALTIPKLELQAAVIASRMKCTILDEINFNVSNIFLWSDSQTVLNYLRNENSHFGTYITHRVNEIRNNTDIKSWNFIPGILNVADDSTRYIDFSNLSTESRWLKGPEFLQKSQDEWPNQEKGTTVINQVTSSKTCKTAVEVQDVEIVKWSHHSSWNKLTRQTAWIIKLKSNWIKWKRGESTREHFTYLSVPEIKESELQLCRLSQIESYPDEYELLRQNDVISKKSRILPLRPIFDNQLIRVGGRISRANLPHKNKHQIILSPKHSISSLIVKHIHDINLHVGREHTLSLVRESYWITSATCLTRKVLHDCLYCKRQRIKPHAPYMSDLPKERLAIGEKPFTYTGIDYFGPITVKLSKKTRLNPALAKRYGVIFTCLTTRAIHLELAGDLSTDCFIMALRRFRSRRGNVKSIRSDNGTNFVGADRELKAAIKQLDQTNISTVMSKYKIDWQFNPPASPWMGGAWESLIKSIKRALKAIVRDRLFTDEALHTFLCEVESILNHRPLTAVSDDIDDFESLTPYHFLLGAEVSNVCPGRFEDLEIDYRKKWRAVQAATNMFWRRWIREYLPLLTQRKKWNREIRNFRTGDLVIVKTDNIPRYHWPLARITSVYPGKDGVVRVVDLKYASGATLTRPSARLCLLEKSS